MPARSVLTVHATQIQSACVFSPVQPGEAFWYENSNGLVEIAVNMGRADRVLELTLGTEVRITKGIAS